MTIMGVSVSRDGSNKKKCHLFEKVNQQKIIVFSLFCMGTKLFERKKMHNSRLALCIKMAFLVIRMILD